MGLAVCTGEFTFSSEVKFSKPIKVEFEYNNPTSNDYIGIFEYSEGDDLNNNPFYGETLQYYTYFCASQTRRECAALDEGKGSVVFNGVDPSEEDSDQWPLNPRSYKLCHIRQGSDGNDNETGELIGECKKLTVTLGKKKKKKLIKKGFVKSKKKKYDYKEEIVIKFDSALKSQNSWIGIYQKNNDQFMWVYTGCNNVDGDQKNRPMKSNDCKQRKKNGKVTFGPDNTGRADFEWPPLPGDYYIRLNYYNNDPHNLYIEGDDTFTVREK